MQLPLAYLDASAIEEVPLGLWREVFEVLGWPQLLTDRRDTFTHEDVRGVLRHDDLSDGLLHALETLHTLGTEAGREAIVSVMNDRRVRSDTLPADIGEREFALRLYLAQRGDASLADVFARAQTHIQEGGDHRRYNEFLGKESKPVTNLAAKRDALGVAVLRHCRDSDLGEHVQVDAFEDDGTYVFHILHSDRTRTPLAVVPGHSARAPIAFRPVHCDILRYEVSIGRLRVAARAASMVEFYRTSLGRILFADELFFTGDPVCTLAVLQKHGRAAFENHDVFGVGRVRMTECLWERGDRNLIQIRSADCFRSIEELGLPLAEGTLLQAKLKIEVIGKSTRPVTVTIRVPSRVEITQKAHEHIVDRLLDAVGIRTTVVAAPKFDLWSLHPWRHPLSVWRAVFGAETDLLVRSHVLTPVRLDAVPHPEYPDAGRVLKVHPVGNGEFQGVSQVAEIPSRSLTATDVEGLELLPEALRHYLRTKLGISSGGVAWRDEELLELGTVEVGGERLYLTYALRQPPRGVGDRLRTRASGAHVALLMPSSRTDDSELAQVILDAASPSQRQVIRAAIAACGLADKVPALYRAPDGARLVVDTRLKQVWVDGVELKDLTPDSHAFRFIELLAKTRGAPLSSDAITEALSAGRLDVDGNTAARHAKLAAKKIIVRAMAVAGAVLSDDPFPTAGAGCYRCALLSYVA